MAPPFERSGMSLLESRYVMKKNIDYSVVSGL